MTFGTVLVIDDEKDLLNLVRYNLERADFKVLESTEGRTGLEIAERVRPDAIVLDWMMPAADGIEVCRRLRADPNTSEIPVLMLTARAEEADRIKGLESGADDYLVKPFSPRELIARLRALLRRRRAERRGDLTIDVVRGRVEFRGAPIPVTPSEFRVLQLLATSPV
jgi:two-component system phosphate regulon response regulator PhoB